MRELLIAWAFGTSAITDAYRLCLSYTTYFAHLIFGEAMTGALVPYLANQANGPESRRGVERAAAVLALWSSIPIGALFLIAPDSLLGFLAPHLPPTVIVWARPFLRVFGLAVPAYCLTSLSIMSRQSVADFRPLGWRPVGQSVAILFGTGAAVLLNKPVLLPVAFSAYYFWLFLIVDRGHLYQLLKEAATVSRYLPTLLGRWIPLAAALGALQSNLLVERYFAAKLPAGTIASLDFARVIAEIPALAVGVPTGAVILVALGSGPTARTFDRARTVKLCLAGLAVVLSSILMVAFADGITSHLYKRGAFGQLSVAHTATALRGLGVGAWAVAANYTVGRWLMATRSPWSILPPAILSVATNFAATALLVPKLKLFGLALGQSTAFVAYFVGALATIVLTRSPEPPRAGPGFYRDTAQLEP
jgi:putative peptidoglycan lipid II flippase